MPVKDALLALDNWFGSEPFRVNSMSKEMVTEIAGLAGIQVPNPVYQRTKIGRWLNHVAEAEYALAPRRGIKLVVLDPADGSKPGLYQVQHVP